MTDAPDGLNQPERIILISTGGTIEKTYDEGEGSLENRRSIILQKLQHKLRLPFTELDLSVLMAKDSLYMTDDDRERIRATLAEKLAEDRPVIVLHGTDTMETTARYCYENLPAPRVPVVFTGAMRPLEFENSDSVQNVTEALMAARLASPGFYISFHNRLLAVPRVTKDRNTGTFVAY